MDLEARCFAIQALGDIGDEQAIEPLLTLLGDNFVAHEVIIALANLNPKITLPIIIKTLAHPDYLMQHYAVIALQNFSNSEVIDALITFVQDDTRYYLARITAVNTICYYPSPNVIEALFQTLPCDNPELQDAIVQWLTKIEN